MYVLKKIWVLLFVIIAILLPIYTPAQSGALRWITEADGLPSKYVWDIHQDNKGDMLMCNNLGLVIYDGKNIAIKNKKHGLPDGSIVNFTSDKYGRIWIDCPNGKICYYKDRKIVSIDEFNQKDANKNGVWTQYFVSENEFIIDFINPFRSVTYKKIKNRWIKTDSLTTDIYRIPIRNPQNCKDILAWFIFDKLENEKKIIITTDKTNSENSFETNFKNTGIVTGFIGKENYFFTVNEWLFVFDSTGMVKKKQFDGVLRKIYPGLNNTIWTVRLDGGVQQLAQNTLEPIGPILFPEYKIRNFLQDREGGLWICTTYDGLAYMPYSRFKKMMVGSTFESLLNTTYCLNDTFYIGHLNGDIYYMLQGEEKERQLYNSPHKKNRFYANYAREFVIGPDSTLYFNNIELGIFSINRKTHQVKHIYQESGCNSFFKSQTALYAAMYMNGILKITKDKQQKTLLKYNSELLSCQKVYTEDDNEMVIGCYTGLYRMKDTVITKLAVKYINNTVVTDIIKLDKGVTAVSSFGEGLIICTTTDTIHYTEENGLNTNYINDLLLTTDGKLYVMTAAGISIISFVEKNNYRKVNIQKILIHECINADNFRALEYDKKIYVTSENGILILSDLSKDPLPSLNYLNINSVKFGNKNVPLDKVEYDYSHEIPIEINFRKNNFNYANVVKYKYRLKGRDEKWNVTENESVLLQGLSPGDYVFEVYAEVKHTNMKTPVKQLKLKVKPLYWQRASFQAGTILLILSMLYGIYRVRVNVIEKNERKNTALQVAMASMEAKALRSQMNPHFIFNSINSIQNVMFKNDLKAAHYYLSKFARLMRSILEFSIHETITLREELEVLGNYMELERLRSDKKFDYTMYVEGNLNQDEVQIPSMLIQPIVENSILHGVLALKETNGIISVTIHSDENSLYINVTDNGIGRVKANEIKEKKQVYYTSMASKILDERLKVLNTIYKNQAGLDVEDIYDENQVAAGTRVILKIPLILVRKKIWS